MQTNNILNETTLLLIKDLSELLYEDANELVEKALFAYLKSIGHTLDENTKEKINEIIEDHLDYKLAKERLEKVEKGESELIKVEFVDDYLRPITSEWNTEEEDEA